MSDNNDIDAKRERLMKRRDELVRKSGVRSRQEGDNWGDGDITREEQQELAQLQEELEQLNNKDDLAVGL